MNSETTLTQLSKELTSALREPGTGQPLYFAEGKFQTNGGEKIGRVVEGIPRFVSDEHLESFGHQWNLYEVAHDEEDRNTFQAKTGFSLKELKGKRVLDAGCGGGRYSKI